MHTTRLSLCVLSIILLAGASGCSDSSLNSPIAAAAPATPSPPESPATAQKEVDEPTDASPTSDSALVEIELLNQLDNFRLSPSFAQYGFGRGGRTTAGSSG